MCQKHYRCTTIATISEIYVAEVQRKCNAKFALQKVACGDIIKKIERNYKQGRCKNVKEARDLEFKEMINNSFLKTVSAFANYGEGRILFGVDDNGNAVGLENPQQACLDLENKINDSITPCPNYTLEIDSKKVVMLKVKEGLDKPYLYRGKAYRRNDTATIEVDRVELNRLTLLGLGRYYDELQAQKQDLQFTVLEKELQEKLGVKKISPDILKTLNLLADNGSYNNAAELLADENQFAGVDIARFGKDSDVILERENLSGTSILSQFVDAIKIFKRNYIQERILGSERITEETIPEKAFREALANALIHRTWDVRAAIRIAMYFDRVEVVSPGGLPVGVSYKEYMAGYVSVLRNPIIANVFFRLNFVETFGTGIRRIIDTYRGAAAEPKFQVSDNAIVVILPLLEADIAVNEDEERIMLLLQKYKTMSSSDIVGISGYNKAKVIRMLNSLLEKNKIKKIGVGRGTRYGV